MMKTHYDTHKSVSFELQQSMKTSNEAVSEHTTNVKIFSHLCYLKISKSSDFVKVQKRIRKIFHNAKLLYGKLIIRRKCRTAKHPYGKISYGESSYGEISYG